MTGRRALLELGEDTEQRRGVDRGEGKDLGAERQVWPKRRGMRLTCYAEVHRIRLVREEEWVETEPAGLRLVVVGQSLITAGKN